MSLSSCKQLSLFMSNALSGSLASHWYPTILQHALCALIYLDVELDPALYMYVIARQGRSHHIVSDMRSTFVGNLRLAYKSQTLCVGELLISNETKSVGT